MTTGFVGQVSIIQVALAGVAGFTISNLAARWGIDFPVAPLIGAVAATAVGLLTAVSALRVRGVQLAVVTLAAATPITLLFANTAVYGAAAVSNYPITKPSWLGIRRRRRPQAEQDRLFPSVSSP